jgi:succinoglycan biosynthesis protein ExoO
MPRATDREVSKPTVSVVIPAYNAAPFVERAVRSALDQTHAVAEVIVVDDASTDSTSEVVAKLSAADDRVKLLSLSTNGGPSKARNAGFAAVTSEWIAVLDADDAYLPERLSHLMSMSADADILADNLLSYDPARGVSTSAQGPAINSWERIDLVTFADARRKHEDFGLFQPVFRGGFLEQHGLRYPENVRHGEDFLLVFEAIARGARYWLTWRPSYLYTMRSSGWSRTVVDYRAMGVYVDELSRRQDLDLSPAVRERLADRVAYIEDLHARHELDTAFRRRRVLDLLAVAAQYPRLWPMIGRKVYRFLVRS